MRVLVSGPRTGFLQDRIDAVLDRYLEVHGRDDFVLIEGCAPGVDTQAWQWAKRRGIANQVLHYPAPWKHLNTVAGPWRNRAMLRVLAPDRVVVFHPDVEKGRGTRDMFYAAQRAGLPIQLVST